MGQYGLDVELTPEALRGSFTERLSEGDRKPGARRTLPPGWDKPIPTTREIAAAYALCGIMFGLKRCRCHKGARLPCEHMSNGVAMVADKLAGR